MRTIFILVISILLFNNLASQNISYARQIIDSLCSPTYAGRGYEFDNDGKAATFLERQFKELKLKKFNNTYRQNFTTNVAVFNGTTIILMDGTPLVIGADCLIKSYSAPVHGTYDVIHFTPDILRDTFQYGILLSKVTPDVAVLVDTLGLNRPDFKPEYDRLFTKNAINARVLIKVSDKNLMHTPAVFQSNYSEIELTRSAYSENCKKIFLDIDTEFLENEPSQNLIGYIKGQTDTCIVFSAHYDHLGSMGEGVYFPGAHDNASGTAMVLDIARHYKSLKVKPHYTLIFILFAGEEIGLIGSFYFTENPLFALSKIKFLINIDIVGSGDKGIQVVNGKEFPNQFNILTSINTNKKYLPQIKIRGSAANSDHYPFFVKGVPSFFIYTLGEYKEYHNIYDRADAVPLSGYEGLFRLLLGFVSEL